jgi:hypothetical protein
VHRVGWCLLATACALATFVCHTVTTVGIYLLMLAGQLGSSAS